jgi:hypothetical protein
MILAMHDDLKTNLDLRHGQHGTTKPEPEHGQVEVRSAQGELKPIRGLKVEKEDQIELGVTISKGETMEVADLGNLYVGRFMFCDQFLLISHFALEVFSVHRGIHSCMQE